MTGTAREENTQGEGRQGQPASKQEVDRREGIKPVGNLHFLVPQDADILRIINRNAQLRGIAPKEVVRSVVRTHVAVENVLLQELRVEAERDMRRRLGVPGSVAFPDGMATPADPGAGLPGAASRVIA